MTPQDKSNFKQVMDTVTALYQKPQLDIDTLRVWFAKLEKFEFNVVTKAFDKYVDNNKFMPTVFDILQLCREKPVEFVQLQAPKLTKAQNHKYSHEVLSVLMLQVVSLGLLKNPTSRTFLSHGRFYQDLIPHPSLVVRLPRCGDHLGVILFANCHERPTRTILKKVRKTLKMMAYCYKFREKLEQQYPALASTADNILSNMSQGVYPYPVAGNSFVSVSNIGHYGYERAKSPLCFNEAQKYTLLQVERRLVWNPAVNDFEPQDRLPISVSADHRVYDGNIPVPLLLSEYFNLMLDKMSDDSVADKEDGFELKHLMHIIDELSKKNIELTYRLVLILQTAWPEFLDLRAWLAEHL